MCEEYPDEVLKVLLETPFWPRDLEVKTSYARYEDDVRMAYIAVFFLEDGDSRIEVMSQKDSDDISFSHRFRNYFGGGQSPQVTAALRFLAASINLDNKEFPQKIEKRKE